MLCGITYCGVTNYVKCPSILKMIATVKGHTSERLISGNFNNWLCNTNNQIKCVCSTSTIANVSSLLHNLYI